MGQPFGAKAGRGTGAAVLKPHGRGLDQENWRQQVSHDAVSGALLTGAT